MLKLLGYEVEFTSIGAGTLECYREAIDKGEPFDTVTLDLTLPGMMRGLWTSHLHH